MLAAWCLMLAAWCLMLACCLLLDAWTPARPIHKGFYKGGAAEGRPLFVEAAASRLPLWIGLAGVQASSSRQQASIRHQAASIKHQTTSIKKLGSETLTRNEEIFFSRLPVSYRKLSSLMGVCIRRIRPWCFLSSTSLGSQNDVYPWFHLNFSSLINIHFWFHCNSCSIACIYSVCLFERWPTQL